MKVLYFAWLRERLNRSEEHIEPPTDVKTVGELIQWLRQNDEALGLAMEKPEILNVAIDAHRVQHDAPIAGARVIALMPPMTGG